EVEHHALRGGMRLAGEHEASIDLVLLQRVALLHLDRAGDKLRPARAAHTTFARVRRVGAHTQGRIQNALTMTVERERRASAVEDDRHLGWSCCCSTRGRRRSTGCGGGAASRGLDALGVEELRVNMRGIDIA